MPERWQVKYSFMAPFATLFVPVRAEKWAFVSFSVPSFQALKSENRVNQEGNSLLLLHRLENVEWTDVCPCQYPTFLKVP